VCWLMAEIERVNKFKYLGSLVTVDSNSTTDIKARLAIARHATLQLTRIWKAKDIGMDLKKQLVRSLIWSTALYGSESWALKKCDEKLVTAFEMWVGPIASDFENQLDWTENQQMDSGEDWYTRRKRHQKLSKYCHWKRRSDSVVLAAIKGEIEGKMFSWEKKNSMDRRCSAVDRRRHEHGKNKCNGKKIRLLVADVSGSFGLRHTNNTERGFWEFTPSPPHWKCSNFCAAKLVTRIRSTQ